MSLLHYVEDVENVGLVLQSRTLLQLPHQRCEVCVALRVSRQVQISNTVGLLKDVSVKQVQFRGNTEVTGQTTLCCPYLLSMWALLLRMQRNFKQVESFAPFVFDRSHR